MFGVGLKSGVEVWVVVAEGGEIITVCGSGGGGGGGPGGIQFTDGGQNARLVLRQSLFKTT
jgi:hypothetical protein